MKKYNRLMLGKAGIYAEQCKQEGFVGADFGISSEHDPQSALKRLIVILFCSNLSKNLFSVSF